jgi:hypothetical protein
MVRISLPTTDDDLIRMSGENPGWRIDAPPGFDLDFQPMLSMKSPTCVRASLT